MSQWLYRGLRLGVKTTRYPAETEASPGTSPGFPVERALAKGDPGAVVERCPTHALERTASAIAVDRRRCVHCFRCARGAADPLVWDDSSNWATFGAGTPHAPRLGPAFARSLHVRVVDAGDCGACLHEVKQLNNPYYNLHRLGFFFTPTPRQADILLVVGPGTDQTREALEKTYAAMPGPRLLVAVGTCALTGGVVEVPGNPPPPLAILHALLIATGRAHSAAESSAAGALPIGSTR